MDESLLLGIKKLRTLTFKNEVNIFTFFEGEEVE